MNEPTRADVDAFTEPTVLEFGTSWCGYCRAAQPDITAALPKHPADAGVPRGRRGKGPRGAAEQRRRNRGHFCELTQGRVPSALVMFGPMRNWLLTLLLVSGAAWAQTSDTDESAYAPSTLAKIMG